MCEVEGGEQKNDILLVAKKTFVIPIISRMKKYIREHAWLVSQGIGLHSMSFKTSRHNTFQLRTPCVLKVIKLPTHGKNPGSVLLLYTCKKSFNVLLNYY